MKIRTTNIAYNECDSFDEIQKHLNDIYGILRELAKNLEVLENYEHAARPQVVEILKKGSRK